MAVVLEQEEEALEGVDGACCASKKARTFEKNNLRTCEKDEISDQPMARDQPKIKWKRRDQVVLMSRANETDRWTATRDDKAKPEEPRYSTIIHNTTHADHNEGI